MLDVDALTLDDEKGAVADALALEEGKSALAIAVAPAIEMAFLYGIGDLIASVTPQPSRSHAASALPRPSARESRASRNRARIPVQCPSHRRQ